MKQPTERLFLGKQIPQTERNSENDIVTNRKQRYRLQLQFENTQQGITDALQNLGVVEARIKGEKFVIWLAEKSDSKTTFVRILTRKELEKLLSPKQIPQEA